MGKVLPQCPPAWQAATATRPVRNREGGLRRGFCGGRRRWLSRSCSRMWGRSRTPRAGGLARLLGLAGLASAALRPVWAVPQVRRPGVCMRLRAVRSRPLPPGRGERRGVTGVGARGARRCRSDAGCGAEAVWAGMRRRRKEPPGRPATARVRARSARHRRAHAAQPQPAEPRSKPRTRKFRGETAKRDRRLLACCRKYRRPGGGDARADGIASGRRCERPPRRRTDERRETAARAPRPHGPRDFRLRLLRPKGTNHHHGRMPPVSRRVAAAADFSA